MQYKRFLEDEEDIEVLEEDGLARRAMKSKITSSKSSQNLSVEVAGPSEAFEHDGLSVPEEDGVEKLRHIKNVFDGRTAKITLAILSMLSDHLAKVATTVDSFWTESWVEYSVQSFLGLKLIAAKALATWSMLLIEEVETIIQDLELTKRSTETTLRNTEKIINDRDYFRERVT
ncbi:hypothetical protein Fot_32344 [Forsythia ovata]|uniref:Uncharacterized protein n=1 Tax=Forsythia ovata TaxID=205694 RepID=A0ABD1T7K4_9LAMI